MAAQLDNFNPLKVNQADIAKLLGVSAMTIRNWSKASQPEEVGRFPVSTKAQGVSSLYQWPAVLAWYVKMKGYKEEARAAAVPVDSSNPERQKLEGQARKAIADAELTEIELAVAQGKLLPAHEVEKCWSDVTLSIREKLLVIPRRVSGLIHEGMTSRQREQVIEDEIRIILTELTRG